MKDASLLTADQLAGSTIPTYGYKAKGHRYDFRARTGRPEIDWATLDRETQSVSTYQPCK